ncbi:hypothetical protein APHWI1_0116 [Anaplasma phagocytophilum str. ApWI1]|uniref:Uncharacterized protein n=1 Tax=Anaplasma phagocytophilum str. ApWI1 TaxID=1359155 RepID=A0A0F3Q1M1_ANAPH|nr:hypothetical protein APHHGE2_0914 [Anaplasma phagocytophilum str. HGE2]KJV85359.1 hypothetical protein APHWI1_0116 [Anaplasma phagocytophilum str. ApWI1]KJV98746.1 hypothetical protein OTSANNIE_0885 [Anaplasma phagocytophilum str. Annie]KJZ98230.1 hypothetical protein APHDU1_1430 [Anaplasma phagocytophilum]KJZ99065.1 hypothetical protein APHCR_0139 [Anaplasma phagocytophilum str. CR1007]
MLLNSKVTKHIWRVFLIVDIQKGAVAFSSLKLNSFLDMIYGKTKS